MLEPDSTCKSLIGVAHGAIKDRLLLLLEFDDLLLDCVGLGENVDRAQAKPPSPCRVERPAATKRVAFTGRVWPMRCAP